jgi:hypothetical protein
MIDMLMTWLAGLSLTTRVRVYNLVLAVAALLAALCWLLPFVDVDELWRLDLDELGKISIATSAIAALLAKANARPTRDESALE